VREGRRRLRWIADDWLESGGVSCRSIGSVKRKPRLKMPQGSGSSRFGAARRGGRGDVRGRSQPPVVDRRDRSRASSRHASSGSRRSRHDDRQLVRLEVGRDRERVVTGGEREARVLGAVPQIEDRLVGAGERRARVARQRRRAGQRVVVGVERDRRRWSMSARGACSA
jgi:hypothetical protein